MYHSKRVLAKRFRDVAAGAARATMVAPRFSDALNLFERRGGTKKFPIVMYITELACNRGDTILCSRRAPANKMKLGYV